jgi:PhnB protein
MAKYDFYLNFNGNTEEAFNFYKSVLGGEFLAVMRFGEAPGCDGGTISDGDKNKIMHIALPLEGGNAMMGTDALKSMGGEVTMGTNFHIIISADSRAEADRLHQALSEGGQVTMPMADQFWGAYFGSCADKFGFQWMVIHEQPKTA